MSEPKKYREWPGNKIEMYPWQIEMHDELCDILEETGHSEESVVQISVGIWGGMKAMQDFKEQKIKELEAKLWVANDKSLRNYDGLAEKADKYDEAVKKIAELEFIVKQLKSDES